MFEDIFTRTNRTLSFYKGKCETLESSCAYYKNELNKAIKKLERLKKSSKSRHRDYKKETLKKEIGVVVI